MKFKDFENLGEISGDIVLNANMKHTATDLVYTGTVVNDLSISFIDTGVVHLKLLNSGKYNIEWNKLKNPNINLSSYLMADGVEYLIIHVAQGEIIFFNKINTCEG